MNKLLDVKLKNVRLILSMIVIATLTGSCHKNGGLVFFPNVSKGSIALRCIDDVRYIVSVDGKQIGDTLTNGSTITEVIEKKTEIQRLIVRDTRDNSLVIDSLLPLPGTFYYLLLQLEADQKPLLFSSHDDEVVPGKDSAKIRFVYTDANLPDSIRMRFYYIDGNTLEHELFDSTIVYKKQLGSYVACNAARYPGGIGFTVLGFDIIDVKTGEALQLLDLDPSSPRFLQGVMEQAPTTGNGLKAKKQTLLLEFGDNNYQSQVYKERYLFGADL